MKTAWKNLLLIILILAPLYAENKKSTIDTIILNSEFFSAFTKIEPIKRDLFLDERLNSVLQGRGYVELVEADERYNMKYRIIVKDSEALNLHIRYNIYTNNEEYRTLLKKSELFEFSGQFIIYTPLNSKKDSYIFDIVLHRGSLVVR
jgi:hypothetical protein